jgi:hypothetical protein
MLGGDWSSPDLTSNENPVIVMRAWSIVFLTILLVATSISCSHSGSGPVTPPVEQPSIPVANSTEGHILWGAWDFTVNPDTLEITVEPMRGIEGHFDVTGFVLPPKCTDCVKLNVLGVDPLTHTYNIKILLKNPTALTGYDVRGIVFLKGPQQFLNPDNWTPLFDKPGDLDRNPFGAFAKDVPSRAFADGETHSAIYRMVLPPGSMVVSFVVDASYPANCPEPYQIDILKGIDFLDNYGSYSESLQAYVRDWQNDIEVVQLDLSALGASSPIDLTFQGGLYKANITNTYGAGPGFYDCWIQAKSSNSQWIFEPIRIEVKGFGQDRLPTVLGLMHKWDLNGNPIGTLSKANMKYEGSDLNWFPPDQPYGDSRLPYYDSIHRAPLSTVPYMINLLNGLEENLDPPVLYNVLVIGSQQLGETFSGTAFSYSPTAQPIADAMEALYTAIGSTLSSSDKNQIASQTAGQPWALQVMTAAMLMGVAEGYQYRQDAVAGYSGDQKNMLFDNGKALLCNEETYIYTVEQSVEFDYPDMYRAAGPVLQAIDQMRNVGLYYVPTSSSAWEWTTPIGKVKLGSSESDAHGSGEYLLLIDPGGADTYDCSAGANSSLGNPFSICIDLMGNDTYENQGEEAFSQGGGRMGVGVLWDANGNDQYESTRLCQGFGNFGVGFLIDSGGSDHYVNDRLGQGSGYYGIGVLVDEWGNDEYDCYLYSQGFGYIKGWGFAYDHEGNDDWEANDTNIIYPGPQTSDHNTSMSQGCGYGMRLSDDPPQWMSGGQGLLFDHGGDDTYICGVFGQATGYWFGTGILADFGGMDTMRGIWYVQSGAAHYATSFLIAKGNENDTYRVSHNVGMGGGHDFSNAFFLEEGGDDIYTNITEVDPSQWPGISLGAGNDCGTGIFVDYGGTDSYGNNNGNTMGHGNFLDFRLRGSWGVFVDIAGTDTYPPDKPGPIQNGTWSLGDVGGGGDFADGIVTWQ